MRTSSHQAPSAWSSWTASSSARSYPPECTSASSLAWMVERRSVEKNVKGCGRPSVAHAYSPARPLPSPTALKLEKALSARATGSSHCAPREGRSTPGGGRRGCLALALAQQSRPVLRGRRGIQESRGGGCGSVAGGAEVSRFNALRAASRRPRPGPMAADVWGRARETRRCGTTFGARERGREAKETFPVGRRGPGGLASVEGGAQAREWAGRPPRRAQLSLSRTTRTGSFVGAVVGATPLFLGASLGRVAPPEEHSPFNTKLTPY